MKLARRQPMSLDAFLAREEAQTLRYEYDGLRPTAMNGGTSAHSLIQARRTVALTTRLRGKPCRFHGSAMKIEVAGSVRYADGFVVCTAQAADSRIVRDPVVMVSILSESTARADLGVKNREYEATVPVHRYVILERDQVAGTMFERIDNDWVGPILRADALLHMPEIGVDVPLADFYVDVAFPDQPQGTEP
jgi:Uma2 family endonuclease